MTASPLFLIVPFVVTTRADASNFHRSPWTSIIYVHQFSPREATSARSRSTSANAARTPLLGSVQVPLRSAVPSNTRLAWFSLYLFFGSFGSECLRSYFARDRL